MGHTTLRSVVVEEDSEGNWTITTRRTLSQRRVENKRFQRGSFSVYAFFQCVFTFVVVFAIPFFFGTTLRDGSYNDMSPTIFLVFSQAACTQDSDCVPALCCHPSSCVEKSRAPNCGAAGHSENTNRGGGGGAAANGHSNGKTDGSPSSHVVGNSQMCPVDAECAPFTLDCGGRCFCTALGECGAIVNMGVGIEGKKVNGGNNAASADSSNFIYVPPPPKKKRVKYGYGYIQVKGPNPKKKRR